MSGYGDERLDEVWQESETLNDDAALAREAEQVFNDQVEALATEPVKRVEHRFRGAVHPSLVHVHGYEIVQQRAVFA